MVQATAVLSMPFPTSSFVSTLPPVTDALVKILTEHGHSFNNRSRARICEGHVGEARLRFPWIWTGAWDCRAGNNMNRSLRLPIAAQLRRGVASTWSAGHHQWSWNLLLSHDGVPTFSDRMEPVSINETSYNSMVKCDIDIRKELYSGIDLSGGSTILPRNLYVRAAYKRKYCIWIGGSIMASLSSFRG